jgi:hypothetical protein
MASGEQPGETTAAPTLRASDAEREQTATLLREHYAAGRITPEELSDRLDVAYAARTVTELEALVHDLPPMSAAPSPPARSAARERARGEVLHAVGVVVLVNVLCIAGWLASGAGDSFWPKWVLLLSGVRLAFTAWGQLGPGGPDDAHHEARLGRGGARRIERGEQTQRHTDRR